MTWMGLPGQVIESTASSRTPPQYFRRAWSAIPVSSSYGRGGGVGGRMDLGTVVEPYCDACLYHWPGLPTHRVESTAELRRQRACR